MLICHSHSGSLRRLADAVPQHRQPSAMAALATSAAECMAAHARQGSVVNAGDRQPRPSHSPGFLVCKKRSFYAIDFGARQSRAQDQP